VRERVAMALFARMGQAASLESFTRLYINGEYLGVYAIVETIDQTFLGRTNGDSTGTLHEYHWLRPYVFEDLGDDLATYETLFEARTNVRASDSVLYQPVRDMVRAINEPSNASWRAQVEAQVDLAQMLTHIAIETFMAEWDGILGYAGLNNFYLYHPTGTSRHLFVPWDRDNAFRDDDPSIFRRVDQNVLVRRALTYPDLYSLYLDVLEQVARSAAAGGWLENEIRTAAAVVAPGAADDPRAPYTLEQHQQDVAFLIDFARRRPQLVLEQVAQARTAAPPAH